jgi:predicted nucleic acid-binding Zn ribbon protein
LQRRPIAALYQPTVIGKEGNKLFERMYGLVGSTADYQLAYSDPREQIWSELLAPTLQQMPPQAVAARAGMSERGVRDIRNKGVVPNSKHFVALAWAAVEFAQAQLQQSGVAFEPFSDALVQLSIRRQHIGSDALATLKEYQRMKEAIEPENRCVVCQQPIKSKDARARYCSSKCRKQAERLRRTVVTSPDVV